MNPHAFVAMLFRVAQDRQGVEIDFNRVHAQRARRLTAMSPVGRSARICRGLTRGCSENYSVLRM